jgi:hypothetical protein
LKEGSVVPTEVVFYKGEEELHKNTTNTTAFKENFIDFPKLGLGSYKVAVRGNYGDQQDGIALPLKVIDSRLHFNMTKSQTADKGQSIDTLKDIQLKKSLLNS